MTTVAENKQAILNLPEDEYGEIVDWLYKQEWNGMGWFSLRMGRGAKVMRGT